MNDLPMWTFCCASAWLLYQFIGYPALLRCFGRSRRLRPVVGDEHCPRISVLIAARNEEKDIAWKLRETMNWDYPADRLQVLVASDASTDRTDEIVKSIEDSRVQLIRMEPRGGKVRALNRLVESSSGEILFFTDANSHIAPSCLRRMVRHFADEKVGCVTGRTCCVTTTSTSAVESGSSVYWDYESLVNRLESQLGAVLACDGAIHCARRSLYTPLSPELANDLELPIRIRGRGYLNVFEPDAIAGEKDTSSPSEEFARRKRICGQGARAMWKLRSELTVLTAWQFVSRKLLRWLTLIPLLMLLAASTLASSNPVFMLLLWAQLFFYATALAALLMTMTGRPVGRIAAVPFYVLLGAAGAFLGVVETCLGRRFDIWEIPTLSRGCDEQPTVSSL